MNSTKQEELEVITAFALRELKRQRNTNDIIERLCQRTGWEWKDAERFLDSVRVDNHSMLEAGKNRLSFLASLSMMVGGMMGVAVFIFWFLYNPRLGRLFVPDNMDDWNTILESQVFALAIQSPLAYFLYGVALIGIGMFVGGIIGLVSSLWRAVVAQR